MSYWSEYLTLDGGMGTELVRCGVEEVDSDPLWSAFANIHSQASVVRAHSNFIDAGADIIITNSYQSNQKTLIKHKNIEPDQADDWLRTSVKLAQQAVSAYSNKILVAGSVGK